MSDKLFVVIKVSFPYALDGFPPASFIVQYTKPTIIRKTILNGCQKNDSQSCLVPYPICESQIIMSLDRMPQVVIKLCFHNPLPLSSVQFFLASVFTRSFFFNRMAEVKFFESFVMSIFKCITDTQNICHTNKNFKNQSHRSVGCIYSRSPLTLLQGLLYSDTKSLLNCVLLYPFHSRFLEHWYLVNK